MEPHVSYETEKGLNLLEAVGCWAVMEFEVLAPVEVLQDALLSVVFQTHEPFVIVQQLECYP